MSVNRYLPHVLVVPEDDANRQLANGFELDPAILPRRLQVLPEVGGWRAVVDQFETVHVNGLNRYPDEHVVLIIDFDRDEGRLAQIKEAIPVTLSNRVFVIGAWSEPEELRSDLGSYEAIGKKLAQSCRDGDFEIWEHRLLVHNQGEIARLRERVRNILFAG